MSESSEPTTGTGQLVKMTPATDKRIQDSLKARIAGKDMVFYQSPHESPIAIELPFVRWLSTKEQPWIRRGVAGRDWQPLQCGWLNDAASLMIVVNKEGHFRQVQPYPHERAAAEAKVLEIGIHVGGHIQGLITVPVRDSCRFTPAQAPANYYIRCLAGPAEYELRLYPL